MRQQLLPTLAAGDLVVMDYLSAHKVASVREAIEAAGAKVVYLPAYSPDLNPFELVFSKLKWLLRRPKAHVEGMYSLLGTLPDPFPRHKCHNYLRHCGYNATLKREGD